MVECSICHKFVPEGNITTHTAFAHKSDSHPSASPLPKQHKKPKAKAQPSEEKVRPEAAGDDLDSLLAKVTLEDSTCAYTVCKKKVNLLGLHCQFCRQKFCMKHGIPEVHGCAEEAKKYARCAQTKPGVQN